MLMKRNIYTVEALKSKSLWTKQKFFWRVKAANGQIILTSEMYVNKEFVIQTSKRFAILLNCEWENLIV